MGEKPVAKKRPRADAERNRLRLLDAAKQAFALDGAATSLEEIARMAGVGIGTLYRHFPTRDALVEEVYRQATTRLGEAADRLTASERPVEALRKWLLVCIDYFSTKKLVAAALGGNADRIYASSGDIMRNALERLVHRAEEAGEIRAVPDPFDLLRAVAGVFYVAPETDWETGACAMVDLLIAGLRRD